MRVLALSLLLPALLLGAGVPAAGDPPAPREVPVRENRLARERSPYLRQHRTNPVDWYPWGPEAFERARAEARPVFLSVGYAACHWCHVMERESFEDEATARVLNEVFVCVKVDREERPDVDDLYMRAVQALAGRGGWPMTVLLTPEGDPFFAGTYLRREALQGLARDVQSAWADRPDAIRDQARRIADHVRDLAGAPDLPAPGLGDADLLRVLETALESTFDATHGGYGTRPKFPPHGELLLGLDWLEGARGRGTEPWAQHVRRTLEGMEEGGVHDHVGGGFHRYSTDERWLLPHFEKMLYDNALLAEAYGRAHALGGDPRFARVARRTLDWLRREMARPAGGYASSLDADTRGEEGLTYTWTRAEVSAALPAAERDLALDALGVLEGGNFEDEATGRRTGRNVLHLPRPLAEIARERGLEEPDLAARVDALLERLREARDRRPQPGLDEKVITAWNGLLLSAFARCGVALDDPGVLEEGRRLAAFLLEACRSEEGALLRFPRESGPEIPGFCEDHVHLAQGLLDLAEATGEARWAEASRALADDLLTHFEDGEAGGFWTTAKSRHERLFARQKSAWDDPIPSDNGAAARLLLRLAARTGEARYRAAADRTLAAWRPLMAQARAAPGLTALFRALALRAAVGERDGAPRGADATAADDLARAEAFLERREVRRGGSVRVAVRVELAEGWHANAAEVSDPSLVPTRLEAVAPAPAALGEVRYPAPAVRMLGDEPLPVLEGTFWIRGLLTAPPDAPPGPRRVVLLLSYQPCDEAACREPRSLRLEVPLRFGDEDGPPRHPSVFAR